MLKRVKDGRKLKEQKVKKLENFIENIYATEDGRKTLAAALFNSGVPEELIIENMKKFVPNVESVL
jgi:hypothetical protein